MVAHSRRTREVGASPHTWKPIRETQIGSGGVTNSSLEGSQQLPSGSFSTEEGLYLLIRPRVVISYCEQEVTIGEMPLRQARPHSGSRQGSENRRRPIHAPSGSLPVAAMTAGAIRVSERLWRTSWEMAPNQQCPVELEALCLKWPTKQILERKIVAIDLNLGLLFCILDPRPRSGRALYEQRTNCLCSTLRSSALPRIPHVCCSLSRRLSCAGILVLGSVPMHVVALSAKVSRHGFAE